MIELSFEIAGADRATVSELVAAVLDGTGMRPTTITDFAAHFEADDGITTVGIAPAAAEIGPATFYTFGPAAPTLADDLKDAFSKQGWDVRPLTASAA